MPGPKKCSVYWAKTAAADLDSIIDYISIENLDFAEQILGEIQRTASRLSLFPHRGRIVPELREHGILIYPEVLANSHPKKVLDGGHFQK